MMRGLIGRVVGKTRVEMLLNLHRGWMLGACRLDHHFCEFENFFLSAVFVWKKFLLHALENGKTEKM